MHAFEPLTVAFVLACAAAIVFFMDVPRPPRYRD